MNLLLDTHVLLWWLQGDSRLKTGAFDLISDEGNDILVSAASLWEIEIKRAKGRLIAPSGLEKCVRDQRFTELSITFGHAVAAGRLPPHHHDPFDRALIAQAQLESLTLVSDSSWAWAISARSNGSW